MRAGENGAHALKIKGNAANLPSASAGSASAFFLENVKHPANRRRCLNAVPPQIRRKKRLRRFQTAANVL
ncbi:MAG: hypothetical protein DBY36_07150 [Clostridiales bacterium]|nr:MAG: hypothetical protein DBY36_07150 [Clostridiales bacterium]